MMIEALEPRIAPALLTPTVIKGVLIIQHDTTSGATEDVTVTQTGHDSFTITDSLADMFPAFTGVKSIRLSEQSSNDTLKFTHDGLAGKLQITFAGGANTLSLEGADSAGGLIKGAVTITGGTGADDVSLQSLNVVGAATFRGCDGMDSFTPDGVVITKRVILGSVESITVNQNAAPVVLGSLLVENDDQLSGPVSFVFSTVSTVLGPLKYCGSNVETDNVTLNGQFLGPVNLMLFGGTNTVALAGSFDNSLLITGGSGDDSVTFHRAQIDFSALSPRYVTAHVSGALTMKLGDGANDVTFNDGSFFEKTVSLITGNGNDTVNLVNGYFGKSLTLALSNGTNMVTAPTNAAISTAVTGTFKYTGGTGVDQLDLNQMVAGHVLLSLGNGANQVSGKFVAGVSASIKTGNDGDTIDIGVTGTGKLKVKLGGGTDSFTFEGGALLAASLDGGAGDDTLVGSTLLPVTAALKNFEHTS